MLHHAHVGLLAGGLAHLGVGLDVAADYLLQPAQEALGDTRGAYHNTPNDADVAGNRMSGDLISGCHNHGKISESKLGTLPMGGSLRSRGIHCKDDPQRFPRIANCLLSWLYY